MHRFTATLVHGSKPPYDSWTFLVIPATVAAEWGRGSKPVRGTLAGTPFRGSASRGEGVLRMPVPHELREAAGVAVGDAVKVQIELDPDPRPVEVPPELRAVLAGDPELADLYDRLPPAHRRAWADHVAGAKRPETRLRRAAKAAEGIRARAFPS